MAEIDRVKQTLAFGQMRNAAPYNIGDHRKKKGQGSGDDSSDELAEEPKDTVQLGDDAPEASETETEARPLFGGESHLDLSA